MASSSLLPLGYAIHIDSLSVIDYLHIRNTSVNLTPLHEAQASAALTGSWYRIHITHKSNSSKAIAMGRIVGDGGWYFSIADVAVLPEHQRKGLGHLIMSTLMERIRKVAPNGSPGAHVMLFASPDARGLYAKYGFKDTMPGNMGMAQWLEKE
jgi:ribosomal protein S18 acetylase RimI-like enzyme